MKRVLVLLALLFALAIPAHAEMDGDCVYTLYSADGNELTMRAGRMYVGDEYISSDDQLYRVASVDDANMTAIAEYIGPATIDEAASTAFASLIARSESEKKIAMYSTHSTSRRRSPLTPTIFTAWPGASSPTCLAVRGARRLSPA